MRSKKGRKVTQGAIGGQVIDLPALEKKRVMNIFEEIVKKETHARAHRWNNTLCLSLKRKLKDLYPGGAPAAAQKSRTFIALRKTKLTTEETALVRDAYRIMLDTGFYYHKEIGPLYTLASDLLDPSLAKKPMNNNTVQKNKTIEKLLKTYPWMCRKIDIIQAHKMKITATKHLPTGATLTVEHLDYPQSFAKIRLEIGNVIDVIPQFRKNRHLFEDMLMALYKTTKPTPEPEPTKPATNEEARLQYFKQLQRHYGR